MDTFDGDRVYGRLVVGACAAWALIRHLDTEPVRCLHCQGKGHMSCAHLFELRNCDAYSSAFEDSMKKIRVTVVHAAD